MLVEFNKIKFIHLNYSQNFFPVSNLFPEGVPIICFESSGLKLYSVISGGFIDFKSGIVPIIAQKSLIYLTSNSSPINWRGEPCRDAMSRFSRPPPCRLAGEWTG